MASPFGKREFMESVSTLDPSASNIRLWAQANKDRLAAAGWKFEDHHRDPKLYSPDGFYVDVIRNAGADDRDWQWIEERGMSARAERDPRLRSREQRQEMYGTWGYAPRRDTVPRETMGDMISRRSPARPVSGVRETDWSPPGPQLVGDAVLPGNIPPPERPQSRNYGTLRDTLAGMKGMSRQAKNIERDMDPKRYRYPVNRRRY